MHLKSVKLIILCPNILRLQIHYTTSLIDIFVSFPIKLIIYRPLELFNLYIYFYDNILCIPMFCVLYINLILYPFLTTILNVIRYPWFQILHKFVQYHLVLILRSIIWRDQDSIRILLHHIDLILVNIVIIYRQWPPHDCQCNSWPIHLWI